MRKPLMSSLDNFPMGTFVWTNTMNDAFSLKNTCRISGFVC